MDLQTKKNRPASKSQMKVVAIKREGIILPSSRSPSLKELVSLSNLSDAKRVKNHLREWKRSPTTTKRPNTQGAITIIAEMSSGGILLPNRSKAEPTANAMTTTKSKIRQRKIDPKEKERLREKLIFIR
jgi:hypothetical protein